MMNAWLSKLLALMALLFRVLRGGRTLRQLPATAAEPSAYPWDTCSDCRVALPGRVHRLEDASYCRPCHRTREAELE